MNNWGWSETSSRLRRGRFWDLSGSYNPCKWWYDKCYLPLLNNQGVEVSTPADPESGGHWENTTVKPPPAADGYSPCQPLLVEGLLNEARESLRDDDGNIHVPPDNATELRSYKVRLYLTKEQKKTAQLWMDAADWSYDEAVVGMQQVGYDPYDSNDMKEMKAQICNLDNIPESHAKFRAVPVVPRDGGMRQAIKAKKKAMKDGTTLKLRSESKLRSRCVVLAKEDIGLAKCNEFIGPLGRPDKKALFSVRMGGGMGTVLSRDRAWVFHRLREESTITKVSKKGEQRVSHGVFKEEALITYDRKVGIYHLVVRFKVPVKHRVIEPDTARVVALDPGDRHFQMYYCPDGTHGELLKGGKQYFQDVDAKISYIQGKMAREKAMRGQGGEGSKRMNSCQWQRHRRNQSRKRRRLHRKLEERRKNAHHNAANFLLSRYDVLIAPRLRTRQMAEDPNRKIHKKTVKSMFNWAHYKFDQILRDKCQTQCGKYVRIGIEPGTSGTCGRCGEWNDGLGTAETFRCPFCNVLLDRDVNGARNNLLAELTHFITPTT